MSEESSQSVWPIFRGNSPPHDGITRRPLSPPWRRYGGEAVEDESLDARLLRQPARSKERGRTFYFKENDPIIQQINTALYLRRPLLVTGKPGTGKSSLAHAIAYELQLGPVLEWPITSRATLPDALYRYDAIGRLQEAQIPGSKVDIGRYIRLGPLGTALLPSAFPRVLLIDEIDKSDIDLPNDLLHVFEEGGYEIPELARLQDQSEMNQTQTNPDEKKVQSVVRVRLHDSDATAPIQRGKVQCSEFPFVVMTSNGERELPPAFLRRCISVEIPEPTPADLERIVTNHFQRLNETERATVTRLIERFEKRRDLGDLATDQLLNAVFLAGQGVDISTSHSELEATVYRPLTHFSGG